MKRQSREINVFSVSALDLFASAMGAFIIVTVLLLPYFPNTGDSPVRVAEVQAKLDKANDALALAKSEIERLQKQDAALAAAKKEIDRLTRQNAAQSAQIASLRKEIDDVKTRLHQRVTLLGIQTEAKSYVLLIDLSGSMRPQGAQKSDFRPLLTASIGRLVRNLNSGTKFAMIGFHSVHGVQLRRWPASGFSTLDPSSAAAAHRQVQGWMDIVNGGTPTRAALTAALEYIPEAIILFSDGAPTDPKSDENWNPLVQDITRKNNGRAEIHAVAVGDYVTNKNFIEFLSQLAANNKGTLVGASP